MTVSARAVDTSFLATVDAQKLLNSFDMLAQADGGTSKLRQLVLDLAIRGMLVNQSKFSAAASVSDMADRSGYPLDVQQPPFELPANWAWSRLGAISSEVRYGYTASARAERHGVRLLRITDIQNDRVNWEDVPGCEIENDKLPAFELHDGDLVIARTGGTIGKTYLVEKLPLRAVFASYLIRVAPLSPMLPQYLKAFSGSSLYWNQLYAGSAGTGQPNVNATTLKTLLVPIPPVDEQKRIVAKVDELMRMLDDLEAKQTKKRETQVRLRSAALGALTSAEGPEEFEAAWKRAAENFEVIFEKADSVAELRNCIFAMAIRGKLTSQSPDDGSAEELRQRVAARWLGKASVSETNGAPFELPSSWTWARLPELGEFGRGRSKHRPRNDPSLFSRGRYPLVQTGDVARSRGYITTYGSAYNEKGLAQSRLWPKGTLCITIAANIADTGLLTFDACFPDSVVGFVPDAEIGVARYFEFFLRTAQQDIEAFAPSTAQKNINLEILSQVTVPLPPFAEQKRIVAKVEQLMKLCDDLEAKLQRSEITASKLVEAVVAEMVA